MFGILTLHDFVQQGAVETGAQLVVVFGIIAVAAVVLYTRKLRWLWREYLTSLSPTKIGIMYLVLSALMLLRGGVDAFMMRSEQALASYSGVGYLAPDHYAQIFTAHGDIMIFFVAMPFMFGLINLIVPSQIGARDVAFPFLNSMSFYLTAVGAMLLNASLVVGHFAATGWLAYPPLSELQYSPGVGVDYYIWALQIAGIGSLLSGINFLVTILTMRVRMRLMQMPMFTWTTLSSMMLVIFAFPILTVTLALLSLDRYLGFHFFTTDHGGSAMLYVNLIWAWGHPEVYILILPAFGIFSEIVSTFSHKRLFGYTSMVVATLMITLLSFVVWLHHFFTMGAGADVNAFFGIMTMAIAIPTGVKVFNWLFTMFRGSITFETPMLWFMGFLSTFVLGGMTGVLLAVPGADFQLHNSLFLVAHFHNMVIGGVLFGYFAGLSYWFPNIFGFKLDERLGKAAFWAWLIGFLATFIPLYILGIMGFTRRLDIVAQGVATPLFIISGIGVCIIALAVALQITQLVSSIKHRQALMGSDPWQGRGPEWAEHTIDEGHSALGLYIGAAAFVLGFALIWHIWWLALLGLAAAALALLVKYVRHETHYA